MENQNKGITEKMLNEVLSKSEQAKKDCITINIELDGIDVAMYKALHEIVKPGMNKGIDKKIFLTGLEVASSAIAKKISEGGAI